MRQQLFIPLRLTLVCLVFFCGVYVCAVWAVAQFAPGKGKGVTLQVQGRYYYENVGQSFSQDHYFWGRPSAVGYNAAGSGGSNKGPANPEYLVTVRARLDTFLVHNPGIDKAQIPADLLTASGSGLDPHISVQAAKVQVKRIAHLRQLSEGQLLQLIENQTEKPFAGIWGMEKINVLKLNLALDKLNAQN